MWKLSPILHSHYWNIGTNLACLLCVSPFCEEKSHHFLVKNIITREEPAGKKRDWSILISYLRYFLFFEHLFWRSYNRKISHARERRAINHFVCPTRVVKPLPNLGPFCILWFKNSPETSSWGFSLNWRPFRAKGSMIVGNSSEAQRGEMKKTRQKMLLFILLTFQFFPWQIESSRFAFEWHPWNCKRSSLNKN